MVGLIPELIESVLSEAAGEGAHTASSGNDRACYHRYVLALEGLGLLEARMGEQSWGEDPEQPVITAITPLGYGYLMELRRTLSAAPSRPAPERRHHAHRLYTIFMRVRNVLRFS